MLFQTNATLFETRINNSQQQTVIYRMNKIYIGCSGFSNKDWKGEFYPDNLPAKNYLDYYADKFNAVEINSTFYRQPTLKTLQNWYSKTPGDFRFFVKIPKTITHNAKIKNSSDTVADFCHLIADGLREKTAGFLFQLPPSFVFSDENLEFVLQAVNDACLNVVEFRHKSWWNDAVMDALTKKKIVFSGVSIPKDIPDALVANHPQFLYYRLHGNPVMFKSLYSEDFLDKLASQIKETDETCYIFFNNTWGMSAIRNAQYLQKLLQEK